MPAARPILRSVSDVLEKPTARVLRRRIFSLAITLALGAIGAWLTVGGGWEKYHHWQAQRLCRQARVAFAHGNPAAGALAVRRALLLDGSALDAHRIVAEQMTDAGAPLAIVWWKQVVRLQPPPGAVADRLALAGAALRFGDLTLVETTLNGLDAAAKATAVWHSLYGKLLAARWQLAAAAGQLATARQQEPGNVAYEFDATSIQLVSTDPATRAAAREDLQKFAVSHPIWQPAARRALLLDSASHGDWAAALVDGRGLAADENAPFSDRVAYLDVLRHADPDAFPVLLDRLQILAERNGPAPVAALVIWLAGHELAPRGVAWAAKLGKEMLAEPGVNQSLASCFFAVRDWAGLQTLLRGASWGPREFLRHAVLARACAESKLDDSARAEWTLAADQALAVVGGARELAGLAADWNWTEKRQALLWSIAQHAQPDAKSPLFHPLGPSANDADWALGELYHNATANGDTRAAFRAAKRMLALHPADSTVRNIHALLALLLNEDRGAAAATAAELHAQDPARADWATTAALALYRSGRATEALRLLSDLSSAELHEPGRAAYYGLMLALNSEKTRATEFLDLADSASLLPEEKALIAEGRTHLR